MITTTEYRMDVLNTAIRFISNEFDINIFELPRTDRKAPMIFGVNWGAYGTVTHKEAYEYASKLETAAAIAELLTDLQLNPRTSDIEQPEAWEKWGAKDYQTWLLADASKVKMYLMECKDEDLREFMEEGI